ncbi:HlyD family type I secretion periplasmic adaptor subunit [Methylobacterium sp. J-026]|uniref:HlyD family type I secretion periplasmic adaptor subunit n=1 Tax=Methylobacterium sp. J-026 TaxID=2836624 RepID=UPI001FB99D4D|nr:HlyD family type I secretion periplasmic adaptor subunit [Methylobacterium sp. J-026]MCJ2132683.1 HlyD family type I secretion periplasmic adaptor subunit [Methylobacterium sp. J-026]
MASGSQAVKDAFHRLGAGVRRRVPPRAMALFAGAHAEIRRLAADAGRFAAAQFAPTSLAPAAGAFDPRASIRRQLVAAGLIAVALVPGIGGWAALTSFAGAVIAPGQLVVESEVKKVQHPTGGVVGELRVKDGDRVRAGDVLVHLDETLTRANLDMTRKALDELAARRARAEAERDGLSEVTFSPSLLLRQGADPEVAALVEGESRLFSARRASRDGQRAQLSERASQQQEEIAGLGEQVAAKAREIRLIGNELKGVHDLYARNLVALSRVTALERDEARLEGERGQLTASIASAKGKIAETRLQILQVDAEMRTEVGKDLAEIRAKWSELSEKRVAAEDQLKRVYLRAPQDGVVHQMSVHTVGGLVTPSEPVMLVVPDADRLAVEVHIQPQDIDNVRVGQRAVLRFSAFNMRTTPEIDGVVSRVSADVASDPKTGMSFYTARIAVADPQRARLGGVRLVPGMPVEAFLQIGERTVLSYLVKPMSDQIAKAWREK